VGVDPNDAMEKYARAAFEAARAKGTANDEDAAKKKNTLRVARGVAEALPLPTSSADAVVCTLTLCSVLDPEAAVAEIRRVLKPGGSFVFVEHVLSDDAALRAQQLALDGLQAKLADGCHLNRRTLQTITSAGFADYELVERFTLPGFGLISSQVAGIAIN
jgi:SAM-dependent methyltransferase